MRILIAPNAFKESLSALEICEILEDAIHTILPAAEIEKVPLADGGDGTLDVLVSQWRGYKDLFETVDSLGRPITAQIGLDPAGKRAILEMASTSGLALLKPEERNPLLASTYGFGLLINCALDHGVNDILLSIGGSATVDGGTGMAAALGFHHLDREGREVPGCGGRLHEIDRIERPFNSLRLSAARFTVLSDVTNPLCGVSGAARVFGPQKGASPGDVEVLESGLAHLAQIWKRDLGCDVANLPGAGAAGGIGAGAMAYLGAELVSGGEWLLDQTGFAGKLEQSDLVITGEGKLDRTTISGKLPGRVATLAKRYQKPCIALCALVDPEALEMLRAEGITEVITIMPEGASGLESIKHAADLLRQAAADLPLGIHFTGV